jgi:hypothetical protein
MEGKIMSVLKKVGIAIAIIVGSWGAITVIRMYALENLHKTTQQALKNMTQNALENSQRMRIENDTRAKRNAEIKKQEGIDKERINKESSNECKFWRLQSKNRPTEKTERKIKEYCSQP